MQGLVSDKTFHLKWNNHLQNLSQLFTTIYSSSALADVTLSCRDGTLKAHKLVLSACSPYFEQIFKDNPCQHPIVILKGIPFSEINLLVEFMYKGSVDVQELDLQSLMHTASELEIRGLAYEARDNAAQLLNVNLEYPAYPQSSSQSTPPTLYQQQQRTDVERLKQIHLYQQSMMRAEEVRRRREEPARTHAAVTNILAAAAREMEEARHAVRDPPGPEPSSTTPGDKRRASCLAPASTPGDVKKKAMTVRFQDDAKPEDRDRASAPPESGGGGASSGATAGAASNAGSDKEDKPAIKVVQLCVLQKGASNDHTDSDEKQSAGGEGGAGCDDEETDSSGSMSDSAEHADARPHVCDVCDLRFQRSSHLSRHRLTHTGERPYTCGGCGRSFARSDKLRVHTKICEREDPTVELAVAAGAAGGGGEKRAEMMSGMVRATHRDSTHLVFTPGGDVMLPPRATEGPTIQATPPDASGLDPPRRGRGRPRKTPLPMTPKIQKRRGRPPKTSLDMEGCVLTGGAVPGGVLPAHHQLLLKRRRGRPPKNYFLPRTGAEGEGLPVELGLADLAAMYGRPNENYNATNLPFGDFSYLTDMMYNPLAYYGPASAEPERPDDRLPADTSRDRTIDVSDSSSSESEERAENEDTAGGDTQIMTVGDCQIVKLPADEPAEPAAADSSTGSAVTITPISTVGDCTIRPLDTA